MNKLVSILIPAYNAKKWIRETIDSAVNQVWPNKEIIIVDDGSTDDTYRIAKSRESKILKVIRQENKGACAARNAAYALAQGEYIQWLDADDLLAPDKIYRQLNYNDGDIDPLLLLSSSFGIFYHSVSRAKFIKHNLWRDLSPIDYFLIKFQEVVWMSQSVWLVSRAISEKAGPWNECLSRDQDGEYFCRVVSASTGVKFIPEAKCYYRRGNVSLSVDISEKALESAFQSRLLCIQALLSLENSDRTRTASLKFLQTFFNIIYPRRNNPNINSIIARLHVEAEKLGSILQPSVYKWKYETVKVIFNQDFADKLKRMMWRVEIGTRKHYDKLWGNLTKGK